MSLIRQLPPSVINKIAAGEVIERPASVVKELLENAIDAGASRIDVTLEQGGMELIRVCDNGEGIAAEQLPLAVASHATSKIQDADDLFRVQTLGFRGEALASIAEISHFVLRSYAAGASAGAELTVHGGELGEVAPCGCPRGTTVEVRRLFFNTPVRRKFMRSTQTELGHSVEAFARVALAYPSIHFTLRHGERIVHDVAPTDSWRERIAAFFGPEVSDELIWIESQEEAAALRGYVAKPIQNRSHNRMQYLFLNGRFIRDRSLQHALGEAYRGLLLTGRYPIAFLRLELRPDVVDVNVHPTKLEVRFEDSGRIYSQLLGTLRSKFLSMDLTAKIGSSEPAADPGPVRGAETPAGLDPVDVERHRQEMTRWARGEAAPARPFELQTSGAGEKQPRFDFQPHPGWRPVPPFRPFPDGSATFPPPLPHPDSSLAAAAEAADPAGPAGQGGTPLHAVPLGPTPDIPAERADDPAAAGPYESARLAASTAPGLQVHNRYLVTESEEGLVVIDQHALHERILYEQLRERVLRGRLESQRLLVPEPVPLLPAEAAAVLDARDALAQMGIEVEPFGGNTVLVSAYPAMLANLGPREVLRSAVELLVGDGKKLDRRDLLDELLHMISCKAAIKAGDHLSREEVQSLLEQRHLFQDTHHCPHGRPTALVFTREELDRRFQRT